VRVKDNSFSIFFEFLLLKILGIFSFFILFLFSDKVKKLAHNSSKANLLKLFDKLSLPSLKR